MRRACGDEEGAHARRVSARRQWLRAES
jgi:hypothetical protein